MAPDSDILNFVISKRGLLLCPLLVRKPDMYVKNFFLIIYRLFLVLHANNGRNELTKFYLYELLSYFAKL